MSFIENIKEKAKQQIKTIVLPEGNDIRTLKAAATVLAEKYANLIILGDKDKILLEIWL